MRMPLLRAAALAAGLSGALARAEPPSVQATPVAPAERTGLPVDFSGLPQLGHCYPAPEPTIWAVHRGGELCSTTFLFQRFRFSLDTDCATGLVAFIETADPAIRIDGVGIGSTFAQAISQGGRLDSEPCHVRLPSGWLAVAVAGCQSSPERTEIDLFALQHH